MRNLLAASTILLASAAVVSAADLPVRGAAPAPVMVAQLPYNWSGFYLGLNAGGAWGSGCTQYTLISALSWPSTCVGNDNTQFTGGAQAGYNFQAGSFVYGLEADVNGVGNSNGNTRAFGYLGNNWRVAGVGDPGVFGTVRARLGFAADRALFYVTGGLAWASGGNDPAISYWDQRPATGAADVVWRRGGASGIGWALGAGAEYAFTQNWTMRAEYLYVDLGSEDNAWSCTAGGNFNCTSFAGFTGRADVNFNVLRVGVNYKFGGNAPVLARY
ncbi:MAG: outer membrane protein [Beijerinckiaceae bacterium]